jgi:hypothetical protein
MPASKFRVAPHHTKAYDPCELIKAKRPCGISKKVKTGIRKTIKSLHNLKTEHKRKVNCARNTQYLQWSGTKKPCNKTYNSTRV